MITSMIANTNRSKKRSRAYKPQDFMPGRRAPKKPKPMSVDASIAFVAMMNRAFGGRDLRGNK